MPRAIKDEESHFWSRAEVQPSGCLEWSGARLPKGYGLVGRPRRFKKRNWLAHRLAWLFTHGEIPPGMYVCHRCDNPSCVNPDHLFLGTASDNMKDCFNKGRSGGGLFTPGHKRGTAWKDRKITPKVSDEDVAEIRRLKGSGLLQREIAEQFRISPNYVSQLQARKSRV